MEAMKPLHVAHALVGAAMVVLAAGVGVVSAPPAGADPGAFGTLTCGCHPKGPAGSAIRRDEITRGIRESLAEWSPGVQRQLSALIR